MLCKRRVGGASIVHLMLLGLAFVLATTMVGCSAGAVAHEAAADTSSDLVNTHQHPRRRHHHNGHHQHLHPQNTDTGVARTDHGSDHPEDDAVLVSYITKKAALELQEKLRHLPQPVTDEQYNELLQTVVTKPKTDPSHPIYNKMYYDFVEAQEKHEEGGQTDQTVEEEPLDVIDLSDKVKSSKRKRPFKKAHGVDEDEDEKQKHQGERRAKRSVPGEAHQVEKRQTGVWTNQYQYQRQHQQQYQWRRPFNALPPPHLVTVVADHEFDEYTGHNWGPASASYVSHWRNGLPPSQPAVPSNWYLPAAPAPGHTQFIVRPHQQPWLSHPVPGVVYNPAFPPKNPAPAVSGLRPGLPDTNSITDEGGDMDLPSRFGEDDEDRFVFDVEERTTTRRPPQNANQSPRFPTRRPPPPLIRDSDNAQDTDAAINSIFNRPREQQQPATTTTRPSTRRTPPPLIRNTDENETGTSNSFAPPQSQSSSASAQPAQRPGVNRTVRPPTFRRTTTTTPPPPPKADEGPSRCVWAIVNCCTPQNRQVRYSCFERFGCGGAFWDINPCNDDVLDSALDAADKYAE